MLNRLSVTQRRTLFALSNLGYADRDHVVHVVGADVDVERLAATVPLVTQTEDGRFRAHELWSTALLHVLEPEETVDLRARVVDQLIADGDLASIILFASFLAYAVYDRVTLKGRPDRGLVTVPKSGPPSNDIIAVVVGVILYLAFLFWLHPLLIGTSPLPQ